MTRILTDFHPLKEGECQHFHFMFSFQYFHLNMQKWNAKNTNA